MAKNFLPDGFDEVYHIRFNIILITSLFLLTNYIQACSPRAKWSDIISSNAIFVMSPTEILRQNQRARVIQGRELDRKIYISCAFSLGLVLHVLKLSRK